MLSFKPRSKRGLNIKITHSNRSEECTSQVASRPCANGFNGKWVKKCKVRSNNNNENHREPRQHEDEVRKILIYVSVFLNTERIIFL